MADSQPPAEHLEDEEEDAAFIDHGDVLVEYQDDGDMPMDDDDDEHGGDEDEEGEGVDDVNIVPEDVSTMHFSAHGKPVFAISVHPTLPIAASGGEDDLGYLWDLSTGEQIAKLTGHTDSVTSTAFSSDGSFVATGGMDGRVRVWRLVSRDPPGRTWEFLTELQGPDEAMWLKWHPRGNVLLAGSNDSTVWLWKLPSGETMQVFAGHTDAVHAGQFTPDGKRILTAAADGTLILWDPRSPTPVWKLSGSDGRFAVEGGITSLAVNTASTVAVVGGADGSVRVVNLTKGDIIGTLDGHTAGESVEAVAFIELTGAGAAHDVVVTGGTDGKACIWDLATLRLRTTLEHKDAVTSLLPHPQPKSHIVTSASADRTLRTWDARTGALLKEHTGHRAAVLSAALGFGGAKVVSAGDDGVCLVFDAE